jgi:beta-galactosidase GanA
VRGGELSNSTANPTTSARSWPKLKALNLNSVVVPVYWDVIEPAEGKFDWATSTASSPTRAPTTMRLVLLWFGSWKNSMSCYAPAWVKTDSARFLARAQFRRPADGNPHALRHHQSRHRRPRVCCADAPPREFDGKQHTVILVQVENEIGMIPEARDRQPGGGTAFAAPVPAELMAYLTAHRETLAPELRDAWVARGARTSGTWTEIFGDGPATSEFFMAWAFGRYVEVVAKAGRAELALPLFANAALIRPGYLPGQYPSAGPLPHLIDVWRAAAPTLDFIPRHLFPELHRVGRRYTRSGNPLFVPEALRSPDAAVNVLYAFGAHDAIGFCPFAIESNTEPAAGYLAASYDLVRQLTPLLVEKQGKGLTAGLLQESLDNRQPQQVRLGRWIFNTSFERAAPPSLADGLAVVVGTENSALAGGGRAGAAPAGGLVIALGEDEFLFAGIGLTVTFSSTLPGQQAGILNVAEGRFVDGTWVHERWLNGDQTHQGRHVRLEPGRFCLQRVKLYRYR